MLDSRAEIALVLKDVLRELERQLLSPALEPGPGAVARLQAKQRELILRFCDGHQPVERHSTLMDFSATPIHSSNA